MSHNRNSSDESTGNRRIFYGVFLTDALREPAVQIQQTLRQTGGKVSWVQRANLHFTLRFIGDTPADRMDEFANAGNRAAAMCNPFQVPVLGVGAFPSARSPRTIWLGAPDATDQFRLLHSALSDALKIAGLAQLEQKPFIPHCTLGRVRDVGASVDGGLTKTIGDLAEMPVGHMTCSKFCLIRSTLSPSGAVYETIGTFPLAE